MSSTQLAFAPEHSSLQENITRAVRSTATTKKRKRAAHVADVHAQPPSKRGSLVEVNGNGPGTQMAAEPFSPRSSAGFNATNSSPDEASAAVAAALRAELDAGSFGQGPTQDGLNRLGGSFDLGPGQSGQPYPSMNAFASGAGSTAARETSAGSQPKPAVGTDEWHKVRRDNHKEVERRRRETINEGINELAKIVPGNEKNKGSILARAVTYINELKARDGQSRGENSLERTLLEQAVDALSKSNDGLKEVNRELNVRCEALARRVCGLETRLGVDAEDGGENGEDGEAKGER